MLTVLIVAVVAVDAVVLVLLLRGQRSAASEPAPRGVRTSIDPDPDNRYPLTSGDSF